MGEHYYSEKPASAHAPRAFTLEANGRTLSITTDAGVFSKAHLDTGTELLLKALPGAFSGRALDLGCGWGPVGLTMAVRWPGAEIVLADINERAVGLAKQNLSANRLSAQVLQSDGFANVPGAFDLIATNPPIRAGKAVIYRLFEEAAARLTPGGALYIVMRKQQGAESAQRFLEGLFEPVEVVERGGGFRVLLARKREGTPGALPLDPTRREFEDIAP